MSEWKAAVEQDVLRDTVRLHIWRHVGSLREYVGDWDLVMYEVGEGEQPTNSGLVLPPGMLEPIAVAIADHLGNRLPSQAEVGVLREWLAAERDRVDRMIEGLTPP